MNAVLEASLHFQDIPSPVGRLRLIASDSALVGIWFEQGRDAARGRGDLVERSTPVLERTRSQLEEYFAARRSAFDLPLEPRGTEFQRRVWSTLLTIPYGETRTYGQIAEQIGNPTAVRAVGAANGRNPISIIAPCHRVIGMNGNLTGFGGGLDAKAYLLSLEAPQKQLLAG